MTQTTQLVSNNRNIVADNRTMLYFNKYLYRATMTIRGANRTRYRDTFDEFCYIPLRVLNEQIASRDQEWVDNMIDLIARSDMLAIRLFYDWKEHYREDLGNLVIRVQQDTVSIYSDDLPLLETLSEVSDITIKQAIISLDSEVLLLKRKPKHKFRVYFKDRKVAPSTLDQINQFCITNKDSVFPSASTAKRIRGEYTYPWERNRVSCNNFIDYDHEAMLTIIMLHFGQFLGRAYRLEKV